MTSRDLLTIHSPIAADYRRPASTAEGAPLVAGADVRASAIGDGAGSIPERAPPATPNGLELPAHTEIELKLVTDPAHLRALLNAPVILAHARNKGRVRHLTTVYCDTPEGALEQAGIAFRIRQCGNRFIIGVKRACPDGSSPLQRDEWEAPAEGDAPDPSPVLPLVPADVQALLTSGPLQPVFTTRLRRHTLRLSLAGGVVEVAFDQGLVQAKNRATPISEIEIELKAGSPAAVYDVASHLAELAPLRPSVRSKAERGFALAFDRPLPGHREARAELSGEFSLDDALLAILRSIVAHLLANQAAAEDGRDPEGVHQMRVGLRRLRAVLTLIRRFAPSAVLDSLRADARWLATALGDARNWDVFLLDLLPVVAHGCSAIEGFGALEAAVRTHRASVYEKTHEALSAPRAGRFHILLGAWIEQRGWRVGAAPEALAMLTAPALAFAGPVLARRQRKVLKRGRHFRHLAPHERHRVRIAVKRLRYSTDFFLSLGGASKSSRRYLHHLSELQELLGSYNDMAATPDRAAELAGYALSPSAQTALGAVIGWQAHGLVRIEPDLRAAWHAFRHAATPWSSWPSPGPDRTVS